MKTIKTVVEVDNFCDFCGGFCDLEADDQYQCYNIEFSFHDKHKENYEILVCEECGPKVQKFIFNFFKNKSSEVRKKIEENEKNANDIFSWDV